jgi:hypothetical protein
VPSEFQFIQFRHPIVHKDTHVQEITEFIAVEDSALCRTKFDKCEFREGYNNNVEQFFP